MLRRIESCQAFTTAEKCRTWFNQLFRYATVEKGLLTNPSADLDIVALPKPPVTNNPYLLMEEIPLFLQKLRGYGDSAATILGVRLLFLTGVRTGELRLAGVVSAMQQSTQAAQGANAQADQAGEFLGNTVELIATINAMNAQIASAAEEQTSAAEEINRGVHQIARAIDSVASQTQRGVKTVDELYMIGNRLQSLLGKFKI